MVPTTWSCYPRRRHVVSTICNMYPRYNIVTHDIDLLPTISICYPRHIICTHDIHVPHDIVGTCRGEHFWCRGLHLTLCTHDIVMLPTTSHVVGNICHVAHDMYPRHQNVVHDMENAPHDMYPRHRYIVGAFDLCRGEPISWVPILMSWVTSDFTMQTRLSPLHRLVFDPVFGPFPNLSLAPLLKLEDGLTRVMMTSYSHRTNGCWYSCNIIIPVDVIIIIITCNDVAKSVVRFIYFTT